MTYRIRARWDEAIRYSDLEVAPDKEEANAKLIADMLAALKAALRWDSFDGTPVKDQIHAAIAKAKGKKS